MFVSQFGGMFASRMGPKAPILSVADARHARGVAVLNTHWNDEYDRGAVGAGFLRNRFSEDQILRLIEAGEVVVATQPDDDVVAYYLSNGQFETPSVVALRAVVADLIATGVMTKARYNLLTQAAVHPAWQRHGLGRQLLSLLRATLSTRYDFLVGRIDAANAAGLAAHLRSGWRLVAEIRGGWLAVVPTREG